MNSLRSTFTAAIADRYRIESELGRGGMAIVYLADDLKHGRRVAIKVLSPHVAEALGHGRFLREIEIAARLTHPHILPLFDSGLAGDQLYYVMPFIAGESLRGRLQRERRLPLGEAVRIAREIAGALAYAHSQGLVHRDIKPENVLLSNGIVLVADFGIAHTRALVEPGSPAGATENPSSPETPSTSGSESGSASASASASASTTDAETSLGETQWIAPSHQPSFSTSSTRAGAVIGTPLYMAPEQGAGRVDLDGRADQYALGCVLYELLTGRPPFRGATLADTLELHARGEAAAIPSSRPDVPAGVVDVVVRAMAKRPDDRFPGMADFAAALEAAVAGSDLVAAPESDERTAPNNLPIRRTRFIGRKREIAECAELLRQTKLLTVTGIGGGGKTRLALELARTQLAQFAQHPDGVWWIDLAPLSDSHRVLPAVGATLSLREQPGTLLLDTLLAHLSDRRALLVFDNCEHLREGVAELVGALRAKAPEVTIVATSRAPLGVEGEQLFPLSSLALPPTDGADFARIAGAEAVRLFVDRARSADPEFELSAQSAPSVVEICRRLDGIPLALELAAARLRLLSVTDLLAKLDDRFRLLVGGGSGAGKAELVRHQTLRATIQWSYDQLDEEEKRLLRVVSVFRGGWTLESAVHILAENADEFEVLDLLGRLLQYSLILADRAEDAPTRFGLLETVREYAQEQLETTAEYDSARLRHLDYFSGLARTASRELHGREVAGWMARLERELENLVGAMTNGQRLDGAIGKAIVITGSLRIYWVNSGRLDLGARSTRALLDHPQARAPDWSRVNALLTSATIAYFQGRRADAEAAAEEALAISRLLGKQPGIVAGLSILGTLASERGDSARAREYLEETVAIHRAGGDSFLLGAALSSLASAYGDVGLVDKSEALYEEAVEVARRVGNFDGLALSLLNLVPMAIGRGELSVARDRLIEAFGVLEGVGLKRHTQAAVDFTAALASAQGDAPTAVRLLAAVDRMVEESRIQREFVTTRLLQGLVDRAREALGADAVVAASAAGRALSDGEAAAEARAWLGRP